MNNIIDARTTNMDSDNLIKGVHDTTDTDTDFDEWEEIGIDIDTQMSKIKELLDKMNSDRFTDIANLHLSCADEYHNEGVEAARAKDYQKACDIVVKGNEEYPENVDLLADCIHYSSLCFRDDIALEYYNKLRQIPWKCYNWRAFSFALDFLQKDFKKNECEIREVIKEFSSNIPYSERAYESEAELEEKLGNYDKAYIILTEAIHRFPNASQCAIKLLEYQLDRGMYNDALKTCRYGLSVIETQPSCNVPFFALCECLILDNLLHIKAIKGEKIAKNEITSLSEKYNILISKFQNALRYYRDVIEMRRNLLGLIDTEDDGVNGTAKVKESKNIEKSE